VSNSLLAFALILSAIVASCFNPDLTGVTVTCDPPLTGACPDGQQCNSAGTCITIGSSPDMAATTIVAEGCAGTPSGLGFDVTLSGHSPAYACPVKFQNAMGKTADAYCKAPYMLCTSAVNVDVSACNKIGTTTTGYFIANVIANRSKFTQPACGMPNGGQTAMWAGCGRSATNLSCGMGFMSVLECGTSSLQCQGSKIGDATNIDSASGVLCCKP